MSSWGTDNPPVPLSTAGDGIAGRGPSYGIATIRVDGGDARAVSERCACAGLCWLCPLLDSADKKGCTLAAAL